MVRSMTTTRSSSSTTRGRRSRIQSLPSGQATRQGSQPVTLRFADRRMLLREDGTERPADPLGQPGIPLAALEEAPRIAAAGNHLADLEAGFRHQKGSRRPKGAALGNQAQDPAFDGEPTARRLRCGKPGKTLARQHDGTNI